MELFKKILAGCEADFDQPLVRYVQAQETGKFTAPYVPEFKIMPLHKLCRQALLWFGAGFKKEAGQLAPFLLRAERFLSLWCPENQFNEAEQHLFYFLSNVEKIHEGNPQFDVQFLESGQMQAAFTASGVRGSPLGSVLMKDVEIRAIGPQALPLNVPNAFGIQGAGQDGWSCTLAQPEVWVQSAIKMDEKGLRLDLRFVGLKPEAPMAVAFYVKAPSCQVGKQVLKPRSLARFHGEGKQVLFHNVSIESKLPHRMQIIPLAGMGCFWNCDFLVSFEVRPSESEPSFSIQIAK